MNRFAVAAALLAVACTAGAWQGWVPRPAASAPPEGTQPVQNEKPARERARYPTQYGGESAADRGFNRGYYGWSYLQASPLAIPLAAAQSGVRDDPGR